MNQWKNEQINREPSKTTTARITTTTEKSSNYDDKVWLEGIYCHGVGLLSPNHSISFF